LEATCIKTLKPILCRQKEFVYSLQISPLVSVSQHNANSIAIFRLNIYFHQYNYPGSLSISLRFVDHQSFRARLLKLKR